MIKRGQTPHGLTAWDWDLLVVALVMLWPICCEVLTVWYRILGELFCSH